jgi:inosose dehydratase
LQNTDPENVAFCFDTHWVYRGSENSELAVFDILKMYGDRIVELHLRQSTNGIWNETFSAPGDIDYTAFAKQLKKKSIRPHLVIEQCLESKTPRKMDVVTAHQKDLMVVKNLFEYEAGITYFSISFTIGAALASGYSLPRSLKIVRATIADCH